MGKIISGTAGETEYFVFEENTFCIIYKSVQRSVTAGKDQKIACVQTGKEAFVVLYQKGKYGVGNTTLPKKWAQGTKEEGPKLRMRVLPGGKLKPYLTVVKNDGEFKYVILTMPLKKSNSAWGVVENGVQLDTEKDTLESLN